MTTPPNPLDAMRREIDEIDDAMHDLLMRRAEIAVRIGDHKTRNADRGYIRPAREAAILRRLVARHHGHFPAVVMVRLWRELMAATSRIQGPFSVAVHAPEKSVGYWDLARDHYGSGTQMTLHRAATLVIRAVADDTATVGVLTVPQDDDANPWWPMLVASGANMPKVVARLPFIDNNNGRFEQLGALAIARADHEPTGDDVSLVAIEATADLSRVGLAEAFGAARLPANVTAVWTPPGEPDIRLYLIEIADYVAADDARLDAVRTTTGERLSRMIDLGGYAVPLGDPGFGDDG